MCDGSRGARLVAFGEVTIEPQHAFRVLANNKRKDVSAQTC